MESEARIEESYDTRQLVLLCRLFFHIDYPHVSLTLKEASLILKVSKPTATKVLDSLVSRGVVSKVRGYLTFYYPIRDDEFRKSLFTIIGFGDLRE